MVAAPTTYRPTGFSITRPYDVGRMSLEEWQRIPPRLVDLAALIFVHDNVQIMGLLNAAANGPNFMGDEFPHVVTHGGLSYLDDGHHRATLALLEGKREVLARVLEV